MNREAMKNALSFDLEYWWSPELLRDHVSEKDKDSQIASITVLLNLLDKHETKATFFVLGKIAEKHPEICHILHKKGHEIASHAYSHRPLHELGREGFKEEIKRSKRLLRSYNPIGFRAPTFSIDNRTKWAFKYLEEAGFRYDSSIFPFKTNLYGVPGAPLSPYKPSHKNIAKHDSNGNIVEFPLTVARIGKIKIPIAGGSYLRFLPFWLLKRMLRRVKKRRPIILYLHPWELYPSIPRVKNLPFHSKLITYYGIDSTLQKLDVLLIEFNFQPIREVLQNMEAGSGKK